MKSKKLTSKSGITIPKDIRAEAGLLPGMAVDIETTPDGVTIRKHCPTCRFCGGIEGVRKVKGLEICPAFADELLGEVMQAYG